MLKGAKQFLLYSIMLCATAAVALGGSSTTTDGFLNLGVGARALSMGGAFTGLANDASASYWNPSGIAQLSSPQFVTMYDAPFEGLSHFYMAFCYKKSEFSKNAFGCQVNYLSSGSMLKTDDQGNETGSFSTTDMAAGLTYARMMSDKLYLGTTLKTVSTNIAELSASGFAADLGMLYKLSDNFNLGLSMQNLGSGLMLYKEVAPFPGAVRLGGSYFTLLQSVNPLSIASDVVYLMNDGTVGVSFGAEYLYRFINIRMGAQQLGDSLTPAFGVGIDQKNVSVDLGVSMNEALGSALKMSVVVRM